MMRKIIWLTRKLKHGVSWPEHALRVEWSRKRALATPASGHRPHLTWMWLRTVSCVWITNTKFMKNYVSGPFAGTLKGCNILLWRTYMHEYFTAINDSYSLYCTVLWYTQNKTKYLCNFHLLFQVKNGIIAYILNVLIVKLNCNSTQEAVA